MHAEPIISLQPRLGAIDVDGPNATPTIFPNITPKAVHTCHCITRAPRIGAGAHSAAYTGTVDDFGPIANPRKRRLIKRLTQLFETACHIDDTAAMKQDTNVAPRRPYFRWYVSEALCVLSRT